jgi:hypothetical protein
MVVKLRLRRDGAVSMVYSEGLDLRELGRPVAIRRASHVEPTHAGDWTADMAPVAGPVLGPFANRGEALEAERRWLDVHHLGA